MSKCHVSKFLDLYAAISDDIVAHYPDLRLDLERDMSRIKSSSACMGIRVFTQFLPDIGKILYRSLSDERLSRHNIPFMKVYKNGVHIPRLFKGIWSRLFAQDGMLKHDIDPTLLMLFSTLLNVGKKYDMVAPDSALFEQTREFYVTDEALPRPSLNWDGLCGDDFDPSGLSVNDVVPAGFGLFDRSDDTPSFTSVLDTVQRTADAVMMELGLLDLSSFRHGPGAVAEAQRGIEKFSFHRWSPRLEEQFPIYGTALPLSGETQYEEGETHSRLLAVPKTIKGPRLIAAEPTDNLWCQFSIMDYLYTWVGKSSLRNSITFRDQEPSRLKALEASTGTGYATIDLKSASDRISLWLVERLVRKNVPFLLQLRACRTSYIDLTIDSKLPSLHRLKKFTTQGSALTFPMQSIFFAIMCIGVGLHHRRLPVTLRNIALIGKEVRVFGDDIITPEDWVETTKRVLEALFLKVNADKTHSTGLFRESCGMDAYAGVDITPAYVTRFGSKSNPLGVASVVECSNNLFKKGLWHAAQMVESTLPRNIRKKLSVRRTPDGSIALFSFSGDREPTTSRRWNPDLQRHEYRALVQTARRREIDADGSLSLRAFLAIRDNRDVEPSFEGLLPWRPLSRWEAIPVIRDSWVGITN